jgi:isoquinoline 1-oxidoreductase beta subunit
MWLPLRQAAATAKAMLVSAAAKKWSVSEAECVAQKGKVIHQKSGKSATYSELSSIAASLPVPDVESLTLKDKKDYTLLGKWVPGVDNRDIVTGKSLFGFDEQLPGMVYACYVKCPKFQGSVKSANLDEIKELPGVKDAFIVKGNGKAEELMPAVAIIANSTWDAFNAQKKLKVDWDLSNASTDSWSEIIETAKDVSNKDGDVFGESGDIEEAMKSADKVMESYYTYPFASHANLEPQNCTAWFHDGIMELWAPTQTPQWLQGILPDLLSLDQSEILIHQKRIGGGFGRRLLNDYACEAAYLAKILKVPVKLVWSREQDMAHDFFRVGGFHRSKASLNKEGKLTGFKNHFVTFSADKNGGDPVRGGGMSKDIFPFPMVPNLKLEQTVLETKIPCGWWRAPGSCTLAWSIQSFLHELSSAAGKDHLEFLLELFGEPRWLEEGNGWALHTGRAADVIKLAAKKGDWGKPLPKGRGRGLAFYFSHAGHFAEVVEVTVDDAKNIKVDKVVVVGDVGLILNKSGAENQVEGSVIDGLSTMALGEITFEKGAVKESNFHNYQLLRMPARPDIDVYFIESDFSPTGLGEPALPPLAPAVCNAIFQATGERIYTLPLKNSGYKLMT